MKPRGCTVADFMAAFDDDRFQACAVRSRARHNPLAPPRTAGASLACKKCLLDNINFNADIFTMRNLIYRPFWASSVIRARTAAAQA